MANGQAWASHIPQKRSIARKGADTGNLRRGNKENVCLASVRPSASFSHTCKKISIKEKLRCTTTNLRISEAALEASQELAAAEAAAHCETQMVLGNMTQRVAGSERAHLEAGTALDSLQDTFNHQYRHMRTLTHQNQRLKTTRTSQRQLFRDLKNTILPEAQAQTQAAQQQLLAATIASEQFQASSQRSLEHAEEEALQIKDTLTQCRRKVKTLQDQVICAKHICDCKIISAEDKIRKQSYTYKMMHGGSYTPGIRMLAQAIAKSGCSQEAVGPMIRLVGSVIGVKIKGKLTRCTMSRTIHEGGVAARLQLGHELARVKSFTTSSDGTSHWNINYDSRHFAYKIPVQPGSDTQRAVIRVMSVSASLNHTAETQVKNMQANFNDLVNGFTASPLGKHSEVKLHHIDMQYKNAGGMGDHAADQKSQNKGNKDVKEDTIKMDLGSQRLPALGPNVLIPVMVAENAQKIADAGGNVAWEKLSITEQVARDVTMMKRLTIRLGKEELAAMPEGDHRKLMLFIWAGCSMHKELNSVKCGNKYMMAWWKKNDIPGPIQLANWDNAATLQEMEEAPDPPEERGVNSDADFTAAVMTDFTPPTKVQQRAMDVTSAGGVKAVSIAGAILNHNNDKKGQQDSYRMHFQSILGRPCNFPDTSSIQYHCFCVGAAELIAYTPEYIDFLEIVKMSKDKLGFNHMEANLSNALHDAKTRSELVVLAVYLNTVSAPYAKFIRGPGSEVINMLTLGPYQSELKAHIKNLIDNPDLAIGPDAISSTATLDRQDWHHPDSMSAVIEQGGELPHLKELFIALMEEALVRWEQFTSEFEYGGLIDTATDEEKDLAWMPTTNDHNEGRLGGWWLYAWTNPSSTIEQYNNIAMFWKSGTHTFMDHYFTAADHQYIRRIAREEDASGTTAKRQEEHVAAKRASAARNTAKAVTKIAK